MLYDDIENKSVFIYAMPSMYHHRHQKKQNLLVKEEKKKVNVKMNQRNFNSENQIKKKELKCSERIFFARCECLQSECNFFLFLHFIQ